MHRIRAELLIPGRGAPVVDGMVVLDGASIAYAGPALGAPPCSPSDVALEVPTVMPGLWDCHTHFAGIRGSVSTEKLMCARAEVAVARSVRDARTMLHAGFTSTREVGGYGIFLAPVIAEGTIAGPSIYSAGSVLSPTGGHSDAHSLPYSWVVDPHRTGGMLAVADGPADCLRAVRRQLRLGAEVIKVCTSGGVISELDDPTHQQFGDEELRVIVEEAGRAGRVVAAHCHGRAGIAAALRAGCRTIEHGTELDERTADAMAEAGAIMVPTRTAFEAFLAHAGSLPDHARTALLAMTDRHRDAVATAHAAGVRIAAGTDLGTSDTGTPLSLGRNGAEFGHLVALGLSPLEAIEAGTATGPATLGDRAPRSGLLAPGYDADVIALDADPVADIGALARPEAVTHVWRGGDLVKSPAGHG